MEQSIFAFARNCPQVVTNPISALHFLDRNNLTISPLFNQGVNLSHVPSNPIQALHLLEYIVWELDIS
jgi:hypothetical protein